MTRPSTSRPPLTRPDVLLVANNFPPVRGGSASVYGSLASCAAGRIMVIAPRTHYADGLPLIGWREHDRLAPFRIERLDLLRTKLAPRRAARDPLFRARDLAIRLRLAWRVLRLRPRAVCIGELQASGWLLRMLRWVRGIRRVVYVHGEEITTEDAYDADGGRRRRALLAADHVIVVSRFCERAVLDLLGSQAAQRVVLIENGVNNRRFHPAPPEADLLARYGLADRFVFITVCRLLEKKGVDHALAAFARLLGEHPDTRYLVVGDGPYGGALRQLAATLGVQQAVTFTGDVPEHELVDHYRLGDVFVMPNRALSNGDTEGFGLVFLEANGCGLPVIAGRDGGSRDAVTDGANGLVVDGHSVEAILAAMRSLRTDATLRIGLRQGGLKAAALADWTSRTDKFLRVCQGKVAAPGSPGQIRWTTSPTNAA